LRRADRIIAIGERMRERLIAKGARPDRIDVIQNWVDTEEIVPGERDNDWAREQGLDDKFVVMHSGNVGHAQNLDNLVRATTFLRDLDDLAVPIIGFGVRHAEISELAERLDADKVRLLPYQPRAVLAQSLAAANLHYVGLAPGLSGFVVPSRLYGILASGRPVVVAADPDSETYRLVEEAGCGVAIPPDRPELLARVIRDAHGGELDLEEMGRRGREYVVREADRSVSLARYRSVIDRMTVA
jgi:glycosyltransferase involved in cell wall biosynthesis